MYCSLQGNRFEHGLFSRRNVTKKPHTGFPPTFLRTIVCISPTYLSTIVSLQLRDGNEIEIVCQASYTLGNMNFSSCFEWNRIPMSAFTQYDCSYNFRFILETNAAVFNYSTAKRKNHNKLIMTTIMIAFDYDNDGHLFSTHACN